MGEVLFPPHAGERKPPGIAARLDRENLVDAHQPKLERAGAAGQVDLPRANRPLRREANRLGPRLPKPPVPGAQREGVVRTQRLHVEYFEAGVYDFSRAELEYPGWLSKLLTHPVEGLDQYRRMMKLLTEEKGAIKVYVSVAAV